LPHVPTIISAELLGSVVFEPVVMVTRKVVPLNLCKLERWAIRQVLERTKGHVAERGRVASRTR
jgi:hypothetical protein